MHRNTHRLIAMRVLDMPVASRTQNLGLLPEVLQGRMPLTVLVSPSRANDQRLAPAEITVDHSGQSVRIR